MLCAAALVLGGLAVMGHRQFDRQASYSRLAERNAMAVQAIERTRQALSDAETGQRGYLLTSQESYLAPYLSGMMAARRDIQDAGRWVEPGRSQKAAIARMARLCEQKLSELKRTVELHREGKPQEALRIVQDNTGKWLMDEFRTVSTALVDEENQRLATRKAEIEQARFATETLFAMALGGLGVAFFGGYVALRKALQLRTVATSQLRHSEALLQAGKRRLKAITDNLPVLISYIGKDQRYEFANEAYRAAWGVDPGSLVGQTVASQFPPAVYQDIEPHIRAVLQGRPVQYERFSGDRVRPAHLQVTYVPDINADGEVEGYYSMVLDITARKEAELSLAASEERHRAVLTHAPDAFIALDKHGCVTEWNKQAEATFGWARPEAMGRVLTELIIPEQARQAHTEGMRRFALTGTGVAVNKRVELTGLHRSGASIPIEITISAVKQDDGTYTANAFLHDISERKEAQARLASSERLLRTITDNLPVLISYIDSGEHIRFINATLERWLGVSPDEAINKPFEDVVGPIHYGDRRQPLRRALAGERVAFQVESTARGTDRHIESIYIPDVQADGSVAGVFTLSTDVTANVIAQRELNALARVDTLTGLPNRRQFEEKLGEAVARSRRDKRSLALMFLDIDHFKPINDSQGHAMGDAVLREFSDRLRSAVRVTDLAARLAGDEFVVILEGVHDEKDAGLVARKVVEAMRPRFDCLSDSAKLGVTASVGVAFAANADVSVETLLDRADEALYKAKAAGRDGWRLLPCAA